MPSHNEGSSRAMIHLDTNYLIGALTRGTPQRVQLRQWFAGGTPLNMSAVARAEFLCGPVSATDVRRAEVMFPGPEPFTAADAVIAARLFNGTGRRRRSFQDCMIAAVAIRCSAELATVNVPDFARFVPFGLVLV